MKTPTSTTSFPASDTMPCSPCPKCGSTGHFHVVRVGNKGRTHRSKYIVEELGSFVRCMNDLHGVCHCGPWITRTNDIEADVSAAIEGWNRQANAAVVAPPPQDSDSK